jgi:hypothetical protein
MSEYPAALSAKARSRGSSVSLGVLLYASGSLDVSNRAI